MTDWKETKSADLKDVSSVKEIIDSLQAVKRLLEGQIAADTRNIAETRAQLEKMRKGRVE